MVDFAEETQLTSLDILEQPIEGLLDDPLLEPFDGPIVRRSVRPSPSFDNRPAKTLRRDAAGLTLSGFCFDLAFVLWMCLMVFNTSLYAAYIQDIYTPTRYVALLLLLFSELTGNGRFLRTANEAVVLILLAIGIITAHDFVLFDILAFAFCARDRDFRHMATLSYRLLLVLLPLIVFSSFVGIIPNYSAWNGGRMRSHIGFRYALFPAQYGYLLASLLCYLKGSRLKLRHLVAAALSNYFIFYYTDSRLSFVFAVLLLSLCFLYNLVLRVGRDAGRREARQNRGPGILRRLFGLLATLSFPVSAMFSIAFAYLYSPGKPWMRALDGVELLGGRLSIAHNALLDYPLSLFGREVHFSGAALNAFGQNGDLTKYDTIDCLYVRMLVCYGVIFTALFVALFTAVTVRALREGNVYLALILVFIALHCTIDNLAIYLNYNTFLLLMGMLISAPATGSRKLVRRPDEGGDA